MGLTSTVLVVDDERSNRDLLHTLLTRFGYRTVTVGGGDEALSRLAPDIDLILLDLNLGQGVAFDVLQAIRSHPEGLFPVVVLSADADTRRVVRSIELGADDFIAKPFHPDLLRVRVQDSLERRRLRREEVAARLRLEESRQRTLTLLDSVVQLGVMISAQRSSDRLLEEILVQAQRFCNADAGTLYLLDSRRELRFEIVRTNSLGIALGGVGGAPIPFPPLPLFDPESGEPNTRYVATYCAHTGDSVNVADAYEAEGFDFSGPRKFDERTGYRSKSFLTVPLKNERAEVIGVLQLINAADTHGIVIPFDPEVERMVTSLSCLATICLEAHLRERGLRMQLESLRIEVDAARQARQVSEITETDYFVGLQQKARALRDSRAERIAS